MKKILPILVIGILVLSSIQVLAIKIDIEQQKANSTMETQDIKNGFFPNPPVYDLVIIAPSVFSKELERLVTHKNDTGIKTILKTTEDIYDKYEGVDPPQEIKFFLIEAKKEWNVTYVLLVGGLKSRIWGLPRDTMNYGAKDWYVPVRYTNLFDNPKHPLYGPTKDPGVICDLYYADLFNSTGNFSKWDVNGDGVFAAWDHPDKSIKDDLPIDLKPEVALGRLACRSKREVKIVVDKIIDYETKASEGDWFKKIQVFSGDGFLDQKDLDIQWKTSDLPNGKYTIFAQSHNSDEVAGNIDKVKVTIDKSAESSITFVHDDHLQVKSYPALPVAEITSPSDGDILGNTDVHYDPERFDYDNEFSGWANVTYINETMYIRGKSYDPRPYGVQTDIHVWVEAENGSIIFSDWKRDLEMYFEGEWVTGEKLLKGLNGVERGGALYYMPNDFTKEIYWASNGKFTGQKDVLDALDKGSGFVFFSGHGSPNVWADHFPGVPGDRKYGSVDGLHVTTLKPWFPFFSLPIFPMTKINNKGKLPVVVIGGCHNSQFNVSLIACLKNHKNNANSMWTYGQPVAECFSWRLVSLARRGAIATIGNTGLGYGRIGKDATTGGGDGWISIEFFRQYGEHGHTILGDVFSEAIKSYIDTFEEDMDDLEEGHAKSVQQWVLLGDPSLRLGGVKSS